MTDIRLSDLKEGDAFRFKGDQEARYVIKRGADFTVYQTKDFIEFLVIEKHEKSVKVRTLAGNVEYMFKFGGYFVNYVPAEPFNCIVYLLTLKS